jgi:hypothetical protein
MATAISTSYVVLVVLLSRLFLHESIGWMKTAGIHRADDYRGRAAFMATKLSG